MIVFDAEKGGFATETLVTQEQYTELQFKLAQVEEQWDEAAAALMRLRTEDEGWNLLGQTSADRDGFTLAVTKKIAEKADLQSVGNPLLKHGFTLRYANVFSKGLALEGEVKPRYKRKLDNLSVHELLFTDEGQEDLEKSAYNVGNLFVIYNKVTGELQRIPFVQITNRAKDPNNESRTAYYLWEHTEYNFDGSTNPIVEWVPVVEWIELGKDNVDEIAQHPVNHDLVIVDQRFNVPTNGHWGIPDCFAAMPYTWAYAEYIRDAASLLKALQMITWKVVGKSKAQAQSAGVQLSQVRKQPGVAVMTADTDLAAVPKAGQVDMNDGLALAAMAASALGVPVASLLSNASVGGAAGVAVALDGPAVAVARARQKRWARFYERVFMAMGIEGLTINFPKITEDPIHRQVSSLATGRATGAIWADEYRNAYLEAMSISPEHDTPPDVEEYAQAQNALGFLQMMEDAEQAEKAAERAEADPLARQGNSGVAGILGEIDNTNRDADRKPGSGTKTELTG